MYVQGDLLLVIVAVNPSFLGHLVEYQFEILKINVSQSRYIVLKCPYQVTLRSHAKSC